MRAHYLMSPWATRRPHLAGPSSARYDSLVRFEAIQRWQRARHGLLTLLGLLAMLAPLWLGPMLVPIEQAIADSHHVCACGMAVGTCGCPECDDLLRQAREGAPPVCPMLKGECGRGTPLVGAASLPPVLPPGLALDLEVPRAVTLLEAAPVLPLFSRAPPPPPTPPPVV